MSWLAEHVARLRGRGKLQARATVSLPPTGRGPAMAIVLVSSLGFGLSPLAPATVASAATAAAAFLLRAQVTRLQWLLAAVVVFAIAVPLGTLAEKRLATPDPRWFILDEVVGQLLVFVFFGASLGTCVLGFVLFRVFDILKLPPADRIDRWHGGWGIMLDDVVAGLYAAAVLYALRLGFLFIRYGSIR